MQAALRNCLLSELSGISAIPEGSTIVGVFDDEALSIVGSSVGLSELADGGVGAIEKLSLARQPLPLTVVYIMMPSSLPALAADLAKGPALYSGQIHVRLLGMASTSALRVLAPHAKRLVSLTELPFGLRPQDSRTFVPVHELPLASLYREQERKAATGTAVATLTSALLTATPVASVADIRIAHSKSSPLAWAVAEGTLKSLTKYAKKAGTPAATSSQQPLPSVSVLVVDRSTDVLAPLLHEFTYEAMAYDVLGDRLPLRKRTPAAAAATTTKGKATKGGEEESSESDSDSDDGDVDLERAGASSTTSSAAPTLGHSFTYTYTTGSGEKKERTVLLDETDDLFLRYRHLHIAKVNELVGRDLKAFLSANEAAQFGSKKDKTLADVSAALRDRPQYTAALQRYSTHQELARLCMSRFNGENLTSLAEVEQTLATGETAEGKTPKSLKGEVTQQLMSPSVSRSNKQRLLLLYLAASHGLDEKTKSAMLDLAELTEEQGKAVANLGWLGVHSAAASADSKKAKKKKGKKGGGGGV
jgi:hypothetical protein